MRGVRPLTATRLDQAEIAQALQQGIKQLLFGLSFNQAGSEFTQHRMIKTGVSQREPQSVLPIDPSAHGIGSLTIRQAFHVLQDRRQGEHRRGCRGLANLGEQSGKLAVLIDRAERVGNVEAERPFGKGSTRDAASFFRRRGRVFRMERH